MEAQMGRPLSAKGLVEEFSMEVQAVGRELVDGDLKTLEVSLLLMGRHFPPYYRAALAEAADRVQDTRARIAQRMAKTLAEVRATSRAAAGRFSHFARFVGFSS